MASNLPRPNFIDRDIPTIEAETKALWETLTEKPLYPAQAENLLLHVLNYREALLRIGIQYASEQNLVNYAVGDRLDQLGALTNTPRLAAVAGKTTLQFTKTSTALGQSVLVPANTRVSTNNGIIFATDANLTIAAGTPTGSITATCPQTGVTGNGFTSGQINQLLDSVDNILSASNTTTSNGGAVEETDDRYRERIKLAPNKYSVAGPNGAYKFWTLTADQSIIDAAILSPRRVLVRVYPLTSSGLPSPEILAAVAAVFTNDSVRPLTDEVEVLSPVEVPYAVEANITLLASADAGILTGQLQAAAAAYTAERRSHLGADIVRSQIIGALSLPGVYSVALTQPAADVVVAKNEWANCSAITLNITGTSEG